MKKTLLTLLAGASVCLNLGAGWPTELSTAFDPCTLTHRDCERIYDSNWNHNSVLAIYDKHLDELYGSWIIPKGWIASGSIWSHHTNMVRCFGMIHRDGASAFVLLSPQEIIKLPIAAIDDDTIVDMNKAWEKLIVARYPDYKLTPEAGGQRLSWKEVPAGTIQALQKELDLRDMKQARYIKLFTMHKDENHPDIHVALICDFSLCELNKQGTIITSMLYSHVKLCFIPDYMDFNKTVIDISTLATRAEKVNPAWDRKRIAHDSEDCKEPDGTAYGINHLVKNAADIEENPYDICPNTFTGMPWRVTPSNDSSLWVNSNGDCLYINARNPNDIWPLNKLEWRYLK